MNNSQCSIIIKGPVLQWNTITYITHTITYTTPSLIYQNSLTQVKVSQFELTKPISKEIENEISKKTEKVEKLISYHSLYDKLCASKKESIFAQVYNTCINCQSYCQQQQRAMELYIWIIQKIFCNSKSLNNNHPISVSNNIPYIAQ